MPRVFFAVSAVTIAPWLAVVGCGESSGDGGAGGAAGQSAGSDAGGATSAGKASGGGSTQAGTGTASGGDNGTAGSPEPGGDAGSGSSDGLVSCDPKQALCKMAPGECPPMQVREVVGTCWGDCIEIERCACNSAAECPDNNQYTCWMGRHCGPYVN